MSEISDRFNTLLRDRGISIYDLCKATGLNNSAVGRLSKGQVLKPNTKTVNTISKYFNVNPVWFRSGHGQKEILKRDTAAKNILDSDMEYYGHNRFLDMNNGQKLMLVPFVDQPAQAGFVSGYADTEFLEQLPYHPILVDQYYKGEYYAFKVVGDSMDDGSKNSIEEGSVVTGRVIDKSLWSSKFHLHKFKNYIIVHNDGILVKEIIDHNLESGTIMIHSLNEMYEDDVLLLDDCLMILNIVDINKKP